MGHKGPNLRAKCEAVNRFLVNANAGGIRNPALREAAISRISHGTRVEPIETHHVDNRGGYLTLGETRTQYSVIRNPRTGETETKRVKTSVLLPKAVIEDIYKVASESAAGKRAMLKPKSAELLRHEGTHWSREVTGKTQTDKKRLFSTWSRDSKQLKYDLGVVIGTKRAEGLVKSHPASQIMEFLDTVHEERMADEAAIKGVARDMLMKSGTRAVRNPQEYFKALEASEKVVMKGRPPEYQRAVMADLARAEAAARGIKFKSPLGPGSLEGWATTIEQFGKEITQGFGGVQAYSMSELMRRGGPVKVSKGAV